VIGGPMRHDTLSKTECDQTDAWAEKPPHNHERQDAVVVPENSADLDLLKSDRPLVYSSKMAEETGGVTDKVAPSQRSTK
jgi:hypothetical protein